MASGDLMVGLEWDVVVVYVQLELVSCAYVALAFCACCFLAGQCGWVQGVGEDASMWERPLSKDACLFVEHYLVPCGDLVWGESVVVFGEHYT